VELCQVKQVEKHQECFEMQDSLQAYFVGCVPPTRQGYPVQKQLRTALASLSCLEAESARVWVSLRRVQGTALLKYLLPQALYSAEPRGDAGAAEPLVLPEHGLSEYLQLMVTTARS
jgi:hypothetical protein